MIPISEINEAAKKHNVLAEIIEKDYVISWILSSLTNSPIKNNFVFYGGTAIKKIYFDDHRFSEDIDLISEDNYTKEELIKSIDCLSLAKDTANIDFNIDPNKIISYKHRQIIYVSYACYDEITGAPKEIQVDFNMKASITGEQSEKSIIRSYSDMDNSQSTLHVMTLNSIFANKLGMLFDMTRGEPRDIFDIWFILQRVDQFNFDFARVCEIVKEKYGIRPNFLLLKQFINEKAYAPKWEIRLAKQLSNLPEIRVVVLDILNKLKQLFEYDDS